MNATGHDLDMAAWPLLSCIVWGSEFWIQRVQTRYSQLTGASMWERYRSRCMATTTGCTASRTSSGWYTPYGQSMRCVREAHIEGEHVY